ncbi:DUF2155 domain-containing protein [Cribrihabitans pelagius]|uniref:DUF2155 domain-containing protein n=1 Tax=Cribrihabitans pelagius TaxID=1765746 RepID=UPI003B5A6D35
MRRAAAAAALVLACLALPGGAQERAMQGSAAVLRALDKVNGQTVDADVPVGGGAEMFGLQVSVADCRYPAENPTGDAYAYLTVRGQSDGEIHFEGWMIASSPALNALDHNRYDVWVMRCSSS